MQLLSHVTSVSPETAGNLRSTGLVRWGKTEEFVLWVDVPARYGECLATSGNPWLIAMLPWAASLGEDIELSLPVDALLLENVQGILAIWKEWYPELHRIAIRCPIQPCQTLTATRTAAFFSGGVDSYFTIARRMPDNPYGIPAVGKVDDLLTVWGFDVGVYDQAQFEPLAKMLEDSAKVLGLNHLIIRTNLRQIEKRIPFKDMWRRLSHGTGLAFAAMCFEKRYKEIIIGSSYTFGNLFPWGSHPLQDPLFSTSATRFLHDGASFTRVQKTALVAQFPPAQTALHVCFALGQRNCSQCDKCYRTMMTLDALNQKDALASAFDWSRYSVQAIRKLFVRSRGDKIFSADIKALAVSKGRADIHAALCHAERRSIFLRPLVRWSEWIMRLPWIWRLGIHLKAFLLKGPIRKI